jgi:hypothetical protein
MLQVVGHHVFQQNTEAGAGCRKGKPAAQGTGSDDGDCCGQRMGLLRGQGLGNILGVRPGMQQVLGNAGALLGG